METNVSCFVTVTSWDEDTRLVVWHQLEKIGYKLRGQVGSAQWKSSTVWYVVGDGYLHLSYSASYLERRSIDCGDNSKYFIALASLTDYTPLYQWYRVFRADGSRAVVYIESMDELAWYSSHGMFLDDGSPVVRKLSLSELVLYFGGTWPEPVVSHKEREKAIGNFVQEVACDGYISTRDVERITRLAFGDAFLLKAYLVTDD